MEKVLQHFGLKCPCDADGPIRRQNIVKILEQVEGYRRQNLERLRENYNWQVARIKVSDIKNDVSKLLCLLFSSELPVMKIV